MKIKKVVNVGIKETIKESKNLVIYNFKNRLEISKFQVTKQLNCPSDYNNVKSHQIYKCVRFFLSNEYKNLHILNVIFYI